MSVFFFFNHSRSRFGTLRNRVKRRKNEARQQMLNDSSLMNLVLLSAFFQDLFLQVQPTAAYQTLTAQALVAKHAAMNWKPVLVCRPTVHHRIMFHLDHSWIQIIITIRRRCEIFGAIAVSLVSIKNILPYSHFSVQKKYVSFREIDDRNDFTFLRRASAFERSRKNKMLESHQTQLINLFKYHSETFEAILDLFLKNLYTYLGYDTHTHTRDMCFASRRSKMDSTIDHNNKIRSTHHSYFVRDLFIRSYHIVIESIFKFERL